MRGVARRPSDASAPGLHLAAGGAAAVSPPRPPVVSESAAPQVKAEPGALTSTPHQALMAAAAQPHGIGRRPGVHVA